MSKVKYIVYVYENVIVKLGTSDRASVECLHGIHEALGLNPQPT